MCPLLVNSQIIKVLGFSTLFFFKFGCLEKPLLVFLLPRNFTVLVVSSLLTSTRPSSNPLSLPEPLVLASPHSVFAFAFALEIVTLESVNFSQFQYKILFYLVFFFKNIGFRTRFRFKSSKGTRVLRQVLQTIFAAPLANLITIALLGSFFIACIPGKYTNLLQILRRFQL